MPGLTLSEAESVLHPPMPRRELARKLKDVAPCGTVYGRRGRRAPLYRAEDIMRAHALWVRSLADRRRSCQNSAQQECA